MGENTLHTSPASTFPLRVEHRDSYLCQAICDQLDCEIYTIASQFLVSLREWPRAKVTGLRPVFVINRVAWMLPLVTFWLSDRVVRLSARRRGWRWRMTTERIEAVKLIISILSRLHNNTTNLSCLHRIYTSLYQLLSLTLTLWSYLSHPWSSSSGESKGISTSVKLTLIH